MKIDDENVEVKKGATILQAALQAGIYIPHICWHPDLPSFEKAPPVDTVYRGAEPVKNSAAEDEKWEGCGLCVVAIEGEEELKTSCNTMAMKGLVVHTNTPEVQKARRAALAKILATHPHACLTCAQQEGCSLTQCSSDVPEKERCCPKFGNCELQKVAEYIGVPAETLKYHPQDLPKITDEPLFIRDANLCIGCLRCVRMCKDVREVEALGFVLVYGKPVVGTVAPTFKESGCKFCGGCVEVCPTGAIMDKELKHPREASLLPCKYNCPIEIDVPRYVHCIAQGKFSEALTVIREKTPFPNILGHICEHPCEDDCRRGELNEPVSICALKRFAAENVGQGTTPANGKEASKPTGKRVAVVGAGPGGLTAAYCLSGMGHSVTVFDSLPEPGGMLLSAIPRYRLPMELLREEIDAALSNGIEFKGNTTIGKDATLDSLLSEGYDAIFVATGAGLSKQISIDGIETEGVLWGLDFLKSVNLREVEGANGRSPLQGYAEKISDFHTKKNVVVVGGGNVAIDVALTCLRLRVEEVELFCLEKWDEMPAYESEKVQAGEEGVNVNCSWGPSRILKEDGKVSGIEFVKCVSVFDEEGKFNPSLDESETVTVSTDTVIMAIGQSCDLSLLSDEMGISDQKTVKVNEETLETTQRGVFAGGDLVSGPASVVKAIAHGRKAAISMDRYLGGQGDIEEVLATTAPMESEPDPGLGREEGFAESPRVKMPCLNMEERKESFAPVELGLGEQEASNEAKRCLRCDLRFDVQEIALPPEAWVEFSAENVNQVPETEGVFQLLDEGKVVIYVKGTMNMKQELEGELGAREDAKYYMCEEDPMYTKRESELIQHFLQAHGKMPKYNEELDDLF